VKLNPSTKISNVLSMGTVSGREVKPPRRAGPVKKSSVRVW
jgi:hypothetical protein